MIPMEILFLDAELIKLWQYGDKHRLMICSYVNLCSPLPIAVMEGMCCICWSLVFAVLIMVKIGYILLLF